MSLHGNAIRRCHSAPPTTVSFGIKAVDRPHIYAYKREECPRRIQDYDDSVLPGSRAIVFRRLRQPINEPALQVRLVHTPRTEIVEPVHQLIRDHIWISVFHLGLGEKPLHAPVSEEQERLFLSLIWIEETYAEVVEGMAQRVITQSNSKLTKENVAALLTREEAWTTLDDETKRELYAMLPAGFRGADYNHDHNVHPLKTAFAKYIKHFIYEWEQDLVDGRNTIRWQNDAKQATGERLAGNYDDWKEQEREDFWGQKLDPNANQANNATNPESQKVIETDGNAAEMGTIEVGMALEDLVEVIEAQQQ